MKNNDILKGIIENKKLNGSKNKPKYATRKLSIGLVSCMLGYAFLVLPSSAKGEELDNNQAVVEAKKEVTIEGSLSEENLEEISKTPSEKADLIKEEKSEKESLLDNSKEEIVEKNAPILEINDENKVEAVGAGEEERIPKDISNEVTNKYVSLTEEGHEIKGVVKPDGGEAVGWEVSFTTPEGTIAGDTFKIDLSDNLSLKGIEPDHENEYPIEINGEIVAEGKRLDRSTILYTFNENISKYRNVRASVKGFAYIDKTKVPNTTDANISIGIGDQVDSHTVKVQYGDPYYTGANLNGISQFTEFNPKTGEFTQVFYINPDSKMINTSTRGDWSFGKVAAFIDGITPDGSKSDVNYTEENTKVTIQKLPTKTNVPDAIIENPVQTDEKTNVKTTFRDGGIEIVFADNADGNLSSNFIDSPYIVTVKSVAAPSETGNNVYSRATLYGGGQFHIMDNNIVTTDGDTDAEGQKDKLGYFIEHHIYYTKENGELKKDQTFTINSSKTQGYDYDKYFTSKNEIADYKFVEVDTDSLKGNPVYDSKGALTRGNYEPGVTKEVTYIYVRDVKLTKGSFTEHHIYEVYKDGILQKDQTTTIDIEKTEGTEKENFKTSAKPEGTADKPKKGFTFVPERTKKSEEITKDITGDEVTSNYINEKDLEVTYVYRKDLKSWTPLEETGKFQEHHIYITKDENGKEIKREVVDGKVSGGTKDMTYKTGKIDKVGFKFVKTQEAKENPSYDKDGKETKGNFKPGVTQEITYIYEKIEVGQTPLEETGKFQEHHIYITKDENGKEIKREVVDGKVSGGTKDMTYTTGKIDKVGFKFVKTQEAKENPSYDKDGKETSGNFKAGVKQEVTYVYEKVLAKVKNPVKIDSEPKNKDGENQQSNAKVRRINQENSSNNVKTGVGSSATILATLAAAVSGLFASKKRKND